MASAAQIHANHQNAQQSTGPITAEGKSNSSLNALTLGLYTRTDFVKPEEQALYDEFRQALRQELAPETLLEQALATEIISANWRLHLCAAAESDLSGSFDPDDATDKTRRSLERARASAHSLLHRSINQLRRLQTDRHIWHELSAPAPIPENMGLADYKQILAALDLRDRGRSSWLKLNKLHDAELASICKSPEPTEPTPAAAPTESASFCKTAPATPRNAPCPCGSREKYKRCCGRNAPPVLGPAPAPVVRPVAGRAA